MLGPASARCTSGPTRRTGSTSRGLRFTYPALNAAAAILLALAALGAAVLIVTVRAAWRQVRAHRRLIRALPVAGALAGASRRCRSSHADAPLAFCAGWLRPRVYVSTGGAGPALRGPSCAPCSRTSTITGALRDPLRLAIGRVLCQALFFLPVLRPLHERYGEVAELTADAAAVAAVDGVAAPLASAMLAFGAATRATSSASRPSASTPCSAARGRGGCRGRC